MFSSAGVRGYASRGHMTATSSFLANSAVRRHRSTLSKLWLPTGGLSAADGEGRKASTLFQVALMLIMT